jgi:hypothetical protein
MGDKAKPLVSHMAGGFAVCELSLFVLAVTSRKIDPISGRCASDIQRPVVNVPHTAKRRKTSASTCKGVGAFFFTQRVEAEFNAV